MSVHRIEGEIRVAADWPAQRGVVQVHLFHGAGDCLTLEIDEEQAKLLGDKIVDKTRGIALAIVGQETAA